MSSNDKEWEWRRRQIDTLKIFNDNVQEICESNEYSINFVAGDTKLIIKINLTPNEIPTLFVTTIAGEHLDHEWLSGEQVVKSPGILNVSDFNLYIFLTKICYNFSF